MIAAAALLALMMQGQAEISPLSMVPADSFIFPAETCIKAEAHQVNLWLHLSQAECLKRGGDILAEPKPEPMDVPGIAGFKQIKSSPR